MSYSNQYVRPYAKNEIGRDINYLKQVCLEDKREVLERIVAKAPEKEKQDWRTTLQRFFDNQLHGITDNDFKKEILTIIRQQLDIVRMEKKMQLQEQKNLLDIDQQQSDNDEDEDVQIVYVANNEVICIDD
jgi:uncharacterized protein YdaU (DUF1376 family)